MKGSLKDLGQLEDERASTRSSQSNVLYDIILFNYLQKNEFEFERSKEKCH